MTYRDYLKQYKAGTLPEKEQKRVEADIERQDAISEYLLEREENDTADFKEEGFFAQRAEFQGEKEQEKQFMRMVNRSIRRAFFKMGAVVAAVVLAIVLFVQFALPGMVAALYYNPGEQVGEHTNRISLDMAVYTELTMPGYDRDSVTVYDRGYGDYDICIYQRYSLNRTLTNINGRIEQGRLTLYDANILKRPVGNAFGWFQMPTGTGKTLEELTNAGTEAQAGGANFFSAAGTKEEALETLKQLPENEKYVAYVTLNDRMSYEEFMEFSAEEEKKGQLTPFWCAVRVNDSGEGEPGIFQPENLGFICDPMCSNALNWNREEYPNLRLWDETELTDWEAEEKRHSDETYMRGHFVSLLRYMGEQEEFLAMWGETPKTYQDAADYVQEHGLEIYGYVTIGEKEELLSLAENSVVYEIYTQKLR